MNNMSKEYPKNPKDDDVWCDPITTYEYIAKNGVWTLYAPILKAEDWVKYEKSKEPNKEKCVNFMQVGDGHCLICHKNYKANENHYVEFHTDKEGNFATDVRNPSPCTEKCGKWFKPAKSKEKCELEHLNPIFYEGYAECSNCGEKIKNSKFSTPSHSWESSLNKEFFSGIPTEEMGSNQVDEIELKAFISKLLQEQKEKSYKEGYYDGEKNEFHNKIAEMSKQKDSLRKLVQSINTKEEHICRFNDGEQDCECYLKALGDVIKIITDLEKEI